MFIDLPSLMPLINLDLKTLLHVIAGKHLWSHIIHVIAKKHLWSYIIQLNEILHFEFIEVKYFDLIELQ